MDYTDKKLENEIKGLLTDKRRKHTEGVMKAADELALRFGADREKARIAALCHDIFRGRDNETLNALIDEFGIDKRYTDRPELSHSKLAAAALKRDYGIDDEDILNAVSYHTTGRAGMSKLEKTVFLADAIEEGRDYPGVDGLRKAAGQDLDRACLLSLRGTLAFLREQGKDDSVIDRDTLEAEKDISEKLMKGELTMDSRDIALTAARAMDDKQGKDIVIIDIAEKSSFADYLVLASGSNERLVQSLVNEVEERMIEAGCVVKSIEGTKESGWMLMDYGDVIVNVLTSEMREKYNIEKVWADCGRVELEER